MLLLSPGPANISERVRMALTNPDIGHRESEFSTLLSDTRSLLLHACCDPRMYACGLLSGSGTTGIEAALTSLDGITSGVLILSNGVYGERAAQIAQIFGISHTIEKFDGTLPLPLDRVEELLLATPHDTVYLVHHETTTGVLNPLEQVAEIAKRGHKRVLADTVSSVAGENMDLPGWGIDLIIGSANKCIRGVPGVAFVVISEEFLEVISRRRQVTFTTDLVSAISKEDAGETPFTPPVQTMYALREALRELAEEGVDNRIAHYRSISGALREGLLDLGLSLLVPREHLSNTMTSVMLPEGFPYVDLHTPLKERGYVIYKSQGDLSQTTFRLGTVGLITQEDIRGFLYALKQVLADGPGGRHRT